MTDREKGFIQGFTAAVVVSIKLAGEVETPIRELWDTCKSSIKKLKEAEVDEHDIEILKEHWKELNK